jgi:hypothetical protein
METGQMTELERLDELIDAHEAKNVDDSATVALNQMIHDLERKYTWSPELHRRLERARRVLKTPKL